MSRPIPTTLSQDVRERLQRAQAALRAAHERTDRDRAQAPAPAGIRAPVPVPGAPDLFASGIVGARRAHAANQTVLRNNMPPAPPPAAAKPQRKPAAAAPQQRGLDLVFAPPPCEPLQDGMAHVKGRIAYMRHEQAGEDFFIFTVQPLGTNSASDRVTVKGHGTSLVAGMEVEIRGEWHSDPRYGRQVHNALVTPVLPVSEEGIRKLLASGFVEGIGPETAERLLQRFGVQLFEVAEKQPNLLLEVPGMGTARVQSLTQTLREKKALPGIMSFLAEVGLGPGMSHRVYRSFGLETVAKVKENPYSLMSVPLMGFSRADEVARRMGVPFDSERRIAAAMEAALLKAAEKGSTAMPVEQMKADMGRVGLLGIRSGPDGYPQTVDRARIEQVVEREIAVSGRFTVRNLLARSAQYNGEPMSSVRAVSLTSMVADEMRIAAHLKRLAFQPVSAKLDVANIHLEHLRADESQQEAAQQSLMSSVSVITGRPGCGKTTVTRAVIEAMESAGLRVMLVAPTGKAAKRLSKATGRPATTVHRALKSSGAGKFGHDAEHPLEADAIVADECSMMGTRLTERFLRAVATGTQLVMVGDKDQLASIEPGNVFADIIASDVIPVSVLKKIHRTVIEGQEDAGVSAITANAHRVMDGLVPQMPVAGQRKDFALVDCDEDEDKAQRILSVYKCLLSRGFEPQDIQVLTPMRRPQDPLGSCSLNMLLKDLLNPAHARDPAQTLRKRLPGVVEEGENGETLGPRMMAFSVGDRVMQMANNKELGIYNGDLGYITEIDHAEKMLTCDFDGEVVCLSFKDLDALDLAYATTFHKVQGSEYKAVIIAVSRSHSHMLDRNMLYTAITRGKEMDVLVGDMSMLPWVVKRCDVGKRMTGLCDEIEELFYVPQVVASSASRPF